MQEWHKPQSAHSDRTSSGAHCDPELAKRIGEKLGKEDWRRGLARSLAKRIGETLGEEDWPGREGEGEGGEAVLINLATLTWQMGKYTTYICMSSVYICTQMSMYVCI